MSKLIVVAKALLINENGDALVLQRSPWEANPGLSHKPDFPGGLVEKGESPSFATVREIKEETGIEVAEEHITIGYTKTFYDEAKNESHTKFLFIDRLNDTPAVTLSFEHESSQWTPVSELLATHKFGQFYAEGIEYLISHKLI